MLRCNLAYDECTGITLPHRERPNLEYGGKCKQFPSKLGEGEKQGLFRVTFGSEAEV